ncbi:unnamed protein product [Amoebophrya sp. A25]|nr:unnamed protein product [Amoebophrya sp. A25]|eukprot:GSA25T00002310001.1
MVLLWDVIALPVVAAVALVTFIGPCTPWFQKLASARLRREFNSQRNAYYAAATCGNVLFLLLVLHTTHGYDLDLLVLTLFKSAALVLHRVDDVLQSMLKVLTIVLLWKFKDRLLMALGVDRPGQLFGDLRDWLTCWGMQRFEPVELHFWKIDQISTEKNVFLNVTMGYNLDHKTRVRTHHAQSRTGSGFVLDLKETVQINYDPMESLEVLTIEVRQQTIYRSELVSRVQVGGHQLQKMIERERAHADNNPILNPYYQTSRTGQVSHNTTRLLYDQGDDGNQLWEKISLVPSGILYMRIIPVRESVLEMDDPV